MEYRYTAEDRHRQLQQLADALAGLMPLLEQYPGCAAQLSSYRSGRDRVLELLAQGFSQDEVTALGRSIPDLFYRYREWEPPGEQQPDGSWREAAWFTELEERL